MEIEFNTSRILKPDAGDAVTPQQATAADPGPDFDTSVARLESDLQSIPRSRPEVISRAKAAASEPTYPPNDLMDRIAGLLVDNL